MDRPRTRRGTRTEAIRLQNSEETERGRKVSRSASIPRATAVAGRHKERDFHLINGVSTRRLRSTTFQHNKAKTGYRNRKGQMVAQKIDGESDLDRKVPTKTHNTRLRNGINKQKRVVSIQNCGERPN